MPEIPADARNRSYPIKRLGDTPKRAWAEKFFDNHDDAWQYYEEQLKKRPGQRIYHPMHSHEDRTVWVGCVEPQ